MRLSLSKPGGHGTVEETVTEDVKLANLGYEQGNAVQVFLGKLDADVHRAQTII